MTFYRLEAGKECGTFRTIPELQEAALRLRDYLEGTGQSVPITASEVELTEEEFMAIPPAFHSWISQPQVDNPVVIE